MNLTSIVFALFCIITLFIYFIVPKKYQWIVLLISSFIFLFYDNLHVATIIQALVVLLPTYFLSKEIEKNFNTKKSRNLLIIGIAIILAQLIYLKYINLFIATANHICNLFKLQYHFNFVYKNSLVGISYYSLIMMSYLIDVYRGTCKSEKNIFKCALFMSYFPILTSGPFVRYNNIKDDLYGNHKLNYKNICYGLVRVFWGLFKILVISQRIGMIVDTIYGDLNTYTFIFTIIAVLLFPLQLYTNFSGSIDIIIGISEIIGIKLPENFTLPFFSRTLTEFWRNWHITLGAWLRDYIFYPLLKSNTMQKLNKRTKKLFGKKIGKKIPLYLSMLVMWTIIGIWHGGAYTYIIGSGLLQFVIMFFEDILEPISKKINNKLGIDTEVFSYKLYQVIRTYLIFSFTMIFFRATSVTNAIDIIKNIFVLNLKPLTNISLLRNIGISISDMSVLLISLMILFIVKLLARRGDIREKLFKQNILFRWTIIYTLVFGVIIFGCYGAGYDATTFIYKQF